MIRVRSVGLSGNYCPKWRCVIDGKRFYTDTIFEKLRICIYSKSSSAYLRIGNVY